MSRQPTCLCGECRTCRNRAYWMQWRDANRDRFDATKRAWYQANRAERIAAAKAWREANPERHAELMRAAHDRRLTAKAQAAVEGGQA